MSESGRFADHFSAASRAYAAHRPSYPDALVDALADAVGDHDLAWDAGCGSGQLSLALARRFARVIATDASAAQLAQAPSHERVEYRCERAEDPSLADASAALCVAAQAAHWFEPVAFRAAVERVVRPGGAVAFVGYGRPHFVGDGGDGDASCGVAAAFDELRDGLLGPYWPPERGHVESGYRTLPFPWPELVVGDLSIERCWDVEQVLGYVASWSCTRAFLAAGRGADLEQAFTAFAARFGGVGVTRTLRWPVLARVGRVE